MGELVSRSERGETIFGVLVAISLGLTVLSVAVANFTDAWRRSVDVRMMMQAQTEARTILDLMAYDIRMAGAGMPLGQADFTTATASLGDAPLPVLTTSTVTAIALRVNESGTSTVLSADFNPSTSTTIPVVSAADILPQSLVYINDMSTGGTSGYQGVVSSTTASTVSVSSSIKTAGVTFQAGSIVEPVVNVTFTSGSDSGITRQTSTGGEAVTLSSHSRFTITYLNSAGTELVLPLTASSIANDLAAVRINVQVDAVRKLLSDSIYTATAEQVVALRNLNLSR